jgi:hypothetical protein
VWLPEADPLFAEPSALLSSKADWQDNDLHSGELDAIAECIFDLRGLVLMARHVVTSFLLEQVAPLNAIVTQCGRLRGSGTLPGSRRVV